MCGLGDEAADADGAADVARAGHLAAGADDVARHLGDLEDVLVGLGRQADHEVELHLPPAGGVRRRDGVDEVLLAHHLVDDLAQALRPALGGERQPGAAAVAAELLGEVDVERVDARARQGQGRLRALVAVGEALGDVGDLGVVGAREAEQPDLLVAGGVEAGLHHLADAGEAPLAHRAGDHAGLAEAAAARAAAEDLDAHALVHRLGERHERLLRVGPLVEVHDRALVHAERDVGAVRRDARDAAVRQVADVVEARDVDAAGAGEAQQRLLAVDAVELGLADHGGHLEHGLLAVAEHRRVDEVGDRLGVERRVTAGEHDRVGLVAVGRVQRDAGEVERLEHVRVAELGREADAEDVELAHRAVAVDGELRDARLAHLRREVGPDRVRPLGQRARLLVEHLVEDHDALVGQADLVGVRVHERPAHVALVPVLDLAVELAADVLDGLAHRRQQRLESWEQALDRHVLQATWARPPHPVTVDRTRFSPLARLAGHEHGEPAARRWRRGRRARRRRRRAADRRRRRARVADDDRGGQRVAVPVCRARRCRRRRRQSRASPLGAPVERAGGALAVRVRSAGEPSSAAPTSPQRLRRRPASWCSTATTSA